MRYYLVLLERLADLIEQLQLLLGKAGFVLLAGLETGDGPLPLLLVEPVTEMGNCEGRGGWRYPDV
jgi:hypothetical protein